MSKMVYRGVNPAMKVYKGGIKGMIEEVTLSYVGFPAVFAGVNVRYVLLVDGPLMYVHVGRGLVLY